MISRDRVYTYATRGIATLPHRRCFQANVSHLLRQIARCARLFNRYIKKTQHECSRCNNMIHRRDVGKKEKRKKSAGINVIRDFMKFPTTKPMRFGYIYIYTRTNTRYLYFIDQANDITYNSMCVIHRVGIPTRIYANHEISNDAVYRLRWIDNRVNYISCREKKKMLACVLCSELIVINFPRVSPHM